MSIAERFHRARFNWEVRAIRKTPPLRPGSESFIVLSMVQHRDVLPYLLALKSFARFLPPAKVVLIADPTLDADDRALLRSHVPHIEFREAAEFHRDGVPRGGCWERLSAISEYARDVYVVQLDADTVAIEDLSAVRQAVRDRVSFTLGTEDVQPIVSCAEIAAWAKHHLDGQNHTQLLAEASLDRFDTTGRFRYARGCAGFAGFSPGSINPAKVLEISARMAELVGPPWSAWGTEQFASNLLVCSSPGARILPHPSYCNPGRITPATVFLHFIGYVRYRSGLYARLARRVSQELDGASTKRPHAV
ncbi:MAG: hypothetical protein Q7K57_54730 [Burkholderiaceae bacterium]|nr:hypothetical protein [Burkholderiaceae bacterium]